jgi:hypothetical protein
MAQLFVEAGYFVQILDKFSTNDYYEKDPYGKYVYNDKNMKFIPSLTPDMHNTIFCYDDPGMDEISLSFRKSIKIDYDVLLGIELGGNIIPYLMHPNAYRKKTAHSAMSLRNNRRDIKLFFGGNISAGVYDKESSMLPGNLTRRGITNALIDHFSDSGTVRVISEADSILQMTGDNYSNNLFIFDATTARVGRNEWLPIISSCDFFLCLPGVLMPMSHNVVEAMSVGTIPILNYPEWMSPMPINRVNCLIYSTLHELYEVIDFVLNIDKNEIDKMRTGVLEYYDKYMDPATLVKSLEDSSINRFTYYYCAEFVTHDFATKRLAAKQ